MLLNFGMFCHHQVNLRLYTNNIDREFEFKTFLFADSHGDGLKRDAEHFHIHNLAYQSDSYSDIRRKIEYLLLRGVSIDTIILTADSHSLSPYRAKYSNNLYSQFLGKRWLKYFPILSAEYTTTLPIIFREKLSPSHKGKIDKKIQIIKFTDSSLEEQIVSMKNRYSSQFPSPVPSIEMQKELSKIILLCKKNGTNLYGLRFPLLPVYNQLIGDNDYGVDSLFKANGFPILSYQDTIAQQSFFKDMDHLNEDGGKILLAKLKRDLK